MQKSSLGITTIMVVMMLAVIAPCATVNCSGVAAWSGNSVSYSVGQLVTYEGSEYQCIQAHTSEPTWDPVDVPALWSLVGTCGSSSTPTPTPVPTATATPKPTATAQPTATAVPVPTATKPQSPTQCGIINAGQGLVPGQSQQSCDGRFSLSMQTDSNLVLYMGTSALWATNTVGDSAAEVIMQSDGNFVIYNTSGGAIWASGTYGNPGAYVNVQTDGNLVVYNSSGSPLWASNTCCHPAPTPTPATLTMLHTSGTNIVNANGNVVQLRGFNLGGWFIMEKWMCPLDSGSLPDTYSVIQELDSRFGVATEQSLILTYQQNWITTGDLQNIKNAGFNAVRVPVWWGQFYPIANVSNSGWRSDAFNELDWLVNNAASIGLYVIIDMHGVVGGQSTSDDTGQENQNAYWTNGNDQGNTAWMWWQIANHYNGNPTVAGYDIMNEPTGAPSTSAVWTAYSSLYSSVRSADPNHIIIMEGTFGNWDWSMLPPPSQYGWTNIVYEMHEYQWNGTAAQVETGASNQVSDFNNHASWNVPGYIGEFNDFNTGASTWQYSMNAYNNAGLSWTIWSYKATDGLVPDDWGWFDPTYWPTTPNISTDSAATIASDWQEWTTANSFGVNTTIGIGAP